MNGLVALGAGIAALTGIGGGIGIGIATGKATETAKFSFPPIKPHCSTTPTAAHKAVRICTAAAAALERIGIMKNLLLRMLRAGTGSAHTGPELCVRY